MHRYLAELIETLSLVLTIDLTTRQGAAMAHLAIGSVLHRRRRSLPLPGGRTGLGRPEG